MHLQSMNLDGPAGHWVDTTSDAIREGIRGTLGIDNNPFPSLVSSHHHLFPRRKAFTSTLHLEIVMSVTSYSLPALPYAYNVSTFASSYT